MKHCILVKFTKETNKKEVINDAKELFNTLTEIQGINYVEFKENCIDRDNRYDFLIRIDMDCNVLSVYDESKQHKQWKNDFKKYIESKAIFDYEQ